jgi:hypothetical protein
LPRQAKVTAACRNLEDAVSLSRRTAVAIGVLMFVLAVVMRFGQLLEKMMHLMGCGIEQKE